MRAVGVCVAILTACALASACGGSNSSPSKGGGGKAGQGAAGEGGANAAGENNVGGESTQAGSSHAGTGGGAAGKAPIDGGGGGAFGGVGAGGGAGTGGEPTAKAITFTVDGNDDVHPISPLIYGANTEGLNCADTKARFTFCRHRSAAWSSYNWENNASNAGRADCFENNDALSASATPGAAVTSALDAADAVDASSIVTIPMLAYAALDKNGGSSAPDCSGDVSKTNGYLDTRFVKNRPRKGSALSLTPDTADGFVNQDEFVAFLKAGHADSKLLFALDNQPELWSGDHAVLRATPLTYAEEVSLSVDYAKMIKDTWPGAQVLGLVGYGYLAALNQQQSPDYDTEGEFYGYFLSELSDASETDGRRLIDYVDLHWLSENYAGSERIISDAATPDVVQARVQAPRELWDPTYIGNTWISNVNGNQPIELLTWLKASVDVNYPETKLALSEWSFGGGNDVSGAIAAADALGIFGQRGLDLAGVVSLSTGNEPYLIGAFQAYRNYDGQGHGFGDTSVAAASSDVALGSIYASIDAADPSRMVLIAINRDAAPLVATLNITHDSSYASLASYVVSAGSPEPVAGDAVEPVSDNKFELTLPPYSVSVLVPGE